MGRMYTVVFDLIGVTAQQDFFELTSSATKAYKLHSVYVGQSSDAGDAQDEQLAWRIQYGTSGTTSGSGGASVTPTGVDHNDAAAGLTAERNNTTKMSSGTITQKHADAFNARAGLIYRPTPEERFVFGGGARLTIELATTPADSLTMSGTAYIEEIA